MAFDEQLSDRIREALIHEADVEEKYMFGGVCYMLNGKMCVGVIRDEMMCRIDPEKEQEALDHNSCRPMDFTGSRMKGYVYVSEEGLRTKKQFDYWIGLCIEFNSKAKATKRKKKKN